MPRLALKTDQVNSKQETNAGWTVIQSAAIIRTPRAAPGQHAIARDTSSAHVWSDPSLQAAAGRVESLADDFDCA